MKTFYSLFVLTLVIFLTSCNNLHIEKRHYRNGFYVNLGHDRDDRSDATSDNQESVQASATTNEDPVPENVSQQPESFNENSQPIPVVQENVPATTVQDNEAARTEEETTRSEVKQGKVPSRESNSTPSATDTMLIIEVILAIFIPPLAVFLHEGITARFWLTLILCLLGGGFFFYPVFGGLWLVAVIIALLVVLDVI